MDAEPSSSAISSPSGSGDPPGNVRKERGAIAAQACETCRKRKQKCDEIRPRCSTCQKFNLTCEYRTPLPTKKDKTLVEILDRLRVIEGKVDHISHQQTTTAASPSNPSPYDAAPTTSLQRPANQQAGSSAESVPTSASLLPSGAASPLQQYHYASAVHQMMAWPMIRQLLDQASPQGSELHGFFMDPDPPAAMLAQQAARQQALSTDGLEGLTMEDRASIGLPLDASGGGSGGRGIGLADLNWTTMENMAKAYFDTFNLIYPIMDRETFSGGLMASVISNGFDASVDSTLVFLVLALGAVAMADSQNMPLAGFKTADDDNDDLTHRPPGVAFFNEARKRLGFSLTDVSLENVQVFALAGLYFESCSRHMDFWRMSISASVACRALVTSNPSELQSPRANLLRRLFWHCSIMETSLNLELELPLTGLEKLEDVVGLPDFDDIMSDAFYPENLDSHFKEHFASQVALRRLTVHFHNTLRNVLGPTPPFSPLASTPSSSSDPIAVTVVDGFFAQLDTWRSMLPQPLRWSDSRAAHFQAPMPQPAYYGQGTMYPPQPALLQAADMFTADLTLTHTHYPYATDVRIALLRTRFLYNKYLIYRPFLFKALHHSSSVGTDDARCVAECLKACLKWPLIMSPTCHRKRMVPSLFLWSQNLLGVLIILHLSRQVPILQTIRASFCPATFDIDAGETVNMSIAWLRDLKDVDPTASWCWDVANRLYRLDDG